MFTRCGGSACQRQQATRPLVPRRPGVQRPSGPRGLRHRGSCRSPMALWASTRRQRLPLPLVASVTGWHASLRCRATTTCSWTAMTTRSTRPRSAAASRWPPLLTGVRVWCDGRLVADHVRCWARHQTISDPVHWPPRPSRATSRRCWGVTRHPSDADEVQLRQLTDYDAAFGLDDSQGWPDGGHHRHDGAGPSRRARLPHRALKTPTLRQSVAQLAERARAESWPHEEFLPACNAGSPPARPTAARPHPAGSVPSPQVAGGVRLRPRSVAQRREHRSPGHPQLHAGQEERGLRRPTRAGKPPGHRPGDPRLPGRPPGSCSPPPPSGSPGWPTPTPPGGCSQRWCGWPDCAAGVLRC